jgi:hypothetical protein
VVRDGPEVQVREGLQEPEVVAPALPLIPRDGGQRVGVDEQPGFVQCAQCRAEVFDAQGGRDLGGGAGAVRAVQEPLEDVVGVTEPDQVGRGRVHRDREVGALPDPRDGLGKGSHALSLVSSGLAPGGDIPATGHRLRWSAARARAARDGRPDRLDLANDDRHLIHLPTSWSGGPFFRTQRSLAAAAGTALTSG